MKKINQLLTERRSAREFDPTYQIGDETLNTLIDAMRMAPSSYGILSQKIVAITSSEIKQVVAPWFYHQPNFVTASACLLVVGANHQSIQAKMHKTLDQKFGKGVESELRSALINRINSTMFSGNVSPEKLDAWCAYQTYITVGVATVAATSLQIDTCIMEGFDNKKVTDYLQSKGLIELDEQVHIAMVLGKSIKVSGEKLRLPFAEFVIKI